MHADCHIYFFRQGFPCNTAYAWNVGCAGTQCLVSPLKTKGCHTALVRVPAPSKNTHAHMHTSVPGHATGQLAPCTAAASKEHAYYASPSFFGFGACNSARATLNPKACTCRPDFNDVVDAHSASCVPCDQATKKTIDDVCFEGVKAVLVSYVDLFGSQRAKLVPVSTRLTLLLLLHHLACSLHCTNPN